MTLAGAADPLELTRQMSRHLSRYTPIDRFATAIFVELDRDVINMCSFAQWQFNDGDMLTLILEGG
jgi:hypothetical protein